MEPIYNTDKSTPHDWEYPEWLSGGWIRNWKHCVSDDVKEV